MLGWTPMILSVAARRLALLVVAVVVGLGPCPSLLAHTVTVHDAPWNYGVMYGHDHRDELYGHWGDDHLYGRAGPDRLAGGDHDDRLYGESGNDELIGGDGHDVCSGGGGADSFTGCEVRV
jgi:hypothetical protein